VVEGWVPDYVIKIAAVKLKNGAYARAFVTGGPIEVGASLGAYPTYAELGAARLREAGVSPARVEAVPAAWVRRDRTEASALALRDRLPRLGAVPREITVVTLGAHARRTWLIFNQVLHDDAAVGILAVPSRDFDAACWWRYSDGVRTVLAEGIAYAYAVGHVAFGTHAADGSDAAGPVRPRKQQPRVHVKEQP